MELPNKKIWAIYYKTISRPMSFEKIYVCRITTLGLGVTLTILSLETPQAEGVFECCSICPGRRARVFQRNAI